MTKQIKVSDETHALLQNLKHTNNYKSIDDVIVHLIRTHEKFKSSELVRLVRE